MFPSAMAFASEFATLNVRPGHRSYPSSRVCTFASGTTNIRISRRKHLSPRSHCTVQGNLSDRQKAPRNTIEDSIREYERYLRDVAKSGSPPHLDGTVHVLAVLRGEELMRPADRTGLHPFVIPLSRNVKGNNEVTGLLRWPTPPPDMELPVIRCTPGDLGVELLANSCSDFVNRAIAAADFGNQRDSCDSIRAACSLALGYQDGAIAASGLGLEQYLLMKVAPFPDIYEGLARFHLAKDDVGSGLIACERAALAFPGWGRAHVFHANVLLELDRSLEARDAARFGLQMPLWTLGTQDALVKLGAIAGYEDRTSLGKIYRRLYEDKREQEIGEGKAPQQVALDRAAFLLDSYVAEGVHRDWNDDLREQLAGLYISAGLEDVATFVQY